MYFVKKITQSVVLFSFFAISSATSFAGQTTDAGLYDPVAPAGSAFVRFLAQEDMENITAKGKKYPNLTAAAPSSYYVVKADDKVKITTGKGTIETALQAGSFYTVLARPAAPIVLKDPVNTDKTKALVGLYNLTGTDGLSLVTGDKNITVIDPVAKDSVGSRAINPLKLVFAAARDGKPVKTLEEKVLERGSAYSVFAVPQGDSIDLIWVQNTTNTRQ